MKVLVTGATGCLGRNLVESLVCSHKIQVTASGRNLSIGKVLASEQIRFEACDLQDKDKVRELVQENDVVVHCAAYASPWGSYQDFYGPNVLGTKNILTAIQECGLRKLIYISTPSLYFNGNSGLNVSETSNLPEKQANHYAATKKIAEELVRKAEIPACLIFRPRALFGPYDRVILPRILRVSKKGFFPLINGGEALADVTYVKNFVDLIQSCLESDFEKSGIFNISNGEPLKISSLLEIVFESLDIKPKLIPVSLKRMRRLAGFVETSYKLWPLNRYEPPLTSHTVGLLGLSQTLDISKAQKELAYNPRISIAEGMKKSIQFMEDKRT